MGKAGDMEALVRLRDEYWGGARWKSEEVGGWGGHDVWARQLADGDYAVALLNRNATAAADLTFDWAAIGLPPDQPCMLHDRTRSHARTLARTTRTHTHNQVSGVRRQALGVVVIGPPMPTLKRAACSALLQSDRGVRRSLTSLQPLPGRYARGP